MGGVQRAERDKQGLRSNLHLWKLICAIASARSLLFEQLFSALFLEVWGGTLNSLARALVHLPEIVMPALSN